MKSIICKASNDIVTSSARVRNDAAVVMQINFTEFNPLTPRRTQVSPFTEISILF